LYKRRPCSNKSEINSGRSIIVEKLT